MIASRAGPELGRRRVPTCHHAPGERQPSGEASVGTISRGFALVLVSLTTVLVAVCAAGIRLSETAGEVAAWGLLGTLAVLTSGAAWVLLRDASDR